MACNIATQRKLVGWDYQQKANAQSSGQYGYKLGNNAPREWWLTMTATQSDPKWAWLDAGILLKQTLSVPPPFQGAWVFTAFGGTQFFTLFSLALPGYESSIHPFSIRWVMDVGIVDGLNPLLNVYQYVQSATATTPKSSAQIFGPGPWVLARPNDGGHVAPLGNPDITPLKCGHNCV